MNTKQNTLVIHHAANDYFESGMKRYGLSTDEYIERVKDFLKHNPDGQNIDHVVIFNFEMGHLMSIFTKTIKRACYKEHAKRK